MPQGWEIPSTRNQDHVYIGTMASHGRVPERSGTGRRYFPMFQEPIEVQLWQAGISREAAAAFHLSKADFPPLWSLPSEKDIPCLPAGEN